MPKPWFHSLKLWSWLLLIGSLTFAGVHWKATVIGYYHRWTQNMHARRAAEAFERRDYEHAIIDGRRALDFDPFDIETNRIIAKSREAQGSDEAIPWRARLNIIRPGDPENSIAWARDALKAGAVETAEDALAGLKATDRTSAEYHDVAALLAIAKLNPATAESHWSTAVQLAPSSTDYRLKLAVIQANSNSEALRASSRKTLLDLAAIPEHRIVALRALIESTLTRQEFPEARKFADQLIASPDSLFSDRLRRLTVLRTQNASDAPQYLETLRDESLKDPEQLAHLLRWMNQEGLPLLVSDWVPALPPALVSRPPVCLAIAETYGRNRDWTKLRAFVEKASWKDFEHMRLAHLAHALENFGNVVAAETTWGRAITECHDKPNLLASLVRLAQSWRSDQWVEIALRRLSADERTPLWMLDAMWTVARKAGDSAELQRLSRLIVNARPKNPEARNNFIRLTLLRRGDEAATYNLAVNFFKESPKELPRAVTYSLSLFLQGRLLEAKETLAPFPESELRQPEPALYYGIYLHASGDTDKSQEFLKIARTGPLLRDEEELIGRVKRESRHNTLAPEPKLPPSAGK
ncbi:MAG: hypothetical protein ABIP20_06340 [Chthoniobacteraceae bacterium]